MMKCSVLIASCLMLFATMSFACESGKVKQGKVKWYDARKGYGFIAPDDSKREIFLHKSTFNNELGCKSLIQHGQEETSDGQRVNFMHIEGKKGVMAKICECKD